VSGKRARGRPPHGDVLTPAEWRVVEAVRHGMSSRVIAARRGISVDAVKYHVGNALAKLGLPNRAALRRWNGVARSSALHGKEMDMSDTVTIGPIGQIARTVSDIGAAEAWYRDVLGLKHLYTFGDLAFFECGGTRLYLTKGADGARPESILYFQVANIQAAHAALQQRGARFINAPHMIHRHPDGTEEWMAAFEDNDGRPLQIMAQVKPRPA
jgi:DNA-binding CsgD family transcriptional regulator/catechol 2,3-dioxygenase-like lactoylglutathione lyase family enzyme